MSDQGPPPHQRNTADDDPLIGSSTGGFCDWLEKVRQVAARSWRSSLAISLVGIALPFVIVSMTSEAMGVRRYLPPDVGDIRGLVDRLPDAVLGLLVTLAALAAAVYIAAGTWAAGLWAIVEEGTTGRRVSLIAAFRFGFTRARSLWPWLLAIGAAAEIGLLCCLLPGAYVIYACSLFGFVAVFERGANPVLRSVALTHRRIGTAAGRVLAALLPYAVYSMIYTLVVNTTFRAMSGLGALAGTTTEPGVAMLRGALNLIQVALLGMTVAVMMIALFVTYAQLRADEGPITAEDLRSGLSAAGSNA